MSKCKSIAWVALAASALAFSAWANNVPGPCVAGYDPTDWKLEGLQYAPSSGLVQWVVKMVCNAVPQQTNPCDFCTIYGVQGWAGPIDGWVNFKGPIRNNEEVACGKWTQATLTTNFPGNIHPGLYRVNAAVYVGLCLGPKTLLHSDSVEFSITY